MKTFLLLCSLIAGSSLGEILSAKGMQQIGDVSFRLRVLLSTIWRMIRNPYLIAGICCLAISFFSFISLLSYADLSFIVPLTALSYITNTFGARFFLKEKISKGRWLGTILVAAGVALISVSGQVESLLNTYVKEWLSRFNLSFTSNQSLGLSFGQALGGPGSISAFQLLFVLRIALSVCAVASIAYYTIALIAGLLWFNDRRRQRALGSSYLPPATIFKPVRGADAEAYENFAGFCRQDYAEYQIIFGVKDENDPAVAIIKRLAADFPHRDLELVISPDEIGFNPKISNLQNMYPKAKHDLLLIVDSDIRVGPDYLRRVVAPLQQPHVGMVTCLYRGANAKTFAALLENIGISSTFGPEVCSARTLEGIAFALGSTIVMRRDLLERIGGFPAVANYLADDYRLGYHTVKEGYQVILSDYVVEHIAGPETLATMLKHQLRWGRAMRISRPWGYRGLILSYGTATSLLALLAWNFSSFAWWLFGVTMLARFLLAFVIGVYGLKDFVLARYLWLVPIRDLMTFGVWIASFTGDEIQWRGARFRVLPGGELAPPQTAEPEREVLRAGGLR